MRPWVQKVTSPASVALNSNDAYLSAAIGILDALHSGTTSIFEYAYAFPNDQIFKSILQAFLDAGVRGWLGIGVNDTGVELGVHPDLILPLDQIACSPGSIVSYDSKEWSGIGGACHRYLECTRFIWRWYQDDIPIRTRSKNDLLHAC